MPKVGTSKESVMLKYALETVPTVRVLAQSSLHHAFLGWLTWSSVWQHNSADQLCMVAVAEPRAASPSGSRVDPCTAGGAQSLLRREDSRGAVCDVMQSAWRLVRLCAEP